MGPLPSRLDHLSSLEMLNISTDFIYVSIPYELSSLNKLQRFIMDDNMSNDNVTVWFSALLGLEVLSLKDNKISWHFPSSLSNV